MSFIKNIQKFLYYDIILLQNKVEFTDISTFNSAQILVSNNNQKSILYYA